ncbi:uncharacterized protein SEPMUDRAFT_77462 [Sphaerulina musiva SO2202]|uniref:Uncharacterized protein n=1 Tax=Sphaerulina musiva (strain SO2202) TaxID=692275 RepID=N1QJE7_SPHMS|nr:uncharacterized protein SEPMUDRAFT_77462 [Sphaerulina musiva SO2202]EMF17320.1 hypothetical protein SEPMUDRAFT_77462 [Sphaerulina musiva SO2202]
MVELRHCFVCRRGDNLDSQSSTLRYTRLVIFLCHCGSCLMPVCRLNATVPVPRRSFFFGWQLQTLVIEQPCLKGGHIHVISRKIIVHSGKNAYHAKEHDLLDSKSGLE